jgi:hypothetical protein
MMALVTGLVVPACGTKSALRTAIDANSTGGDSGDGRSPADVISVDSKLARIPASHRPQGSVCPQQRGAGLLSLSAPCAPDAGPQTQCWLDADCTAGTNGRCFGGGPMACMSSCSYDNCLSDSDCPSSVPCDCRASASDTAANTCMTGSNCRVDADCGPGGYCSPSLVGVFCACVSTAFCNPDAGGGCYEGNSDGTWTQVPCACGDSCGHGYFCHTPQDTCLNDSDCSNGSTCDFDLPSQTWICTGCWPVP